MEALDKELREIIEIHSLLSGEYAKCPLSAKDLKFHAGVFAEALRARLNPCLKTGHRREADDLVSELLSSIGGLTRPLSVRLRNVTLTKRRLFNREFYKRYPEPPRELSRSEKYDKMLRSMGHLH
jgi:hypothetical protein